MAGGAVEPDVTAKVSVRHRPALVVGCPAAASMPLAELPIVSVTVEGPVMTKLSKSSLNWQMLSLHGQILSAQFPLSEP